MVKSCPAARVISLPADSSSGTAVEEWLSPLFQDEFTPKVRLAEAWLLARLSPLLMTALALSTPSMGPLTVFTSFTDVYTFWALLVRFCSKVRLKPARRVFSYWLALAVSVACKRLISLPAAIFKSWAAASREPDKLTFCPALTVMSLLAVIWLAAFRVLALALPLAVS